jgi:hypothetical protein
MDNTRTIPGYKVYVDGRGSRPDVCVAFLDVRQEPGASVNGVCVPVDAEQLAALDERERNYERVDVTGCVEPCLGRTWAYVGRADSRHRLSRAVAAGRCVVARRYLEVVEAGFRAVGGWEEFLSTTAGFHPPVRELFRVDI